MPSQIILFSQPRSGCHMLERILSKQSNLKWLWHPFESSMMLQNAALNSTEISDPSNEINEIRVKYAESSQKSVAEWKVSLAASQSAGQIHFVHEHPWMMAQMDRMLEWGTAKCHTHPNSPARNVTVVPDSLLLHANTLPIFTIRNPLLSMPSAYRAICVLGFDKSRTGFLGINNLACSHELYDFYISHNVQPLVVDADDYMTSEEFIRHLCTKAGLNPAEALFHWSAASQQEIDAMHPQLMPIQGTLLKSQGPSGSRAAKNVDLDEERRKWKSEFNEEQLELVQELVDRAMPHYEYLWARRLTL